MPKKTPRTAWKKGQSGNPAGRPKDGESWAAIIKSVGDMYPADIVAFVGKDNDLGSFGFAEIHPLSIAVSSILDRWEILWFTVWPELPSSPPIVTGKQI